MRIVAKRTRWFSAKLLFECRVNGEPASLIEESLRVVRASSEDEARAKARKAGVENAVSYENEAGEQVEWSFVEVLELQDLDEETLVDGVEVYSRLRLSGEED